MHAAAISNVLSLGACLNVSVSGTKFINPSSDSTITSPLSLCSWVPCLCPFAAGSLFCARESTLPLTSLPCHCHAACHGRRVSTPKNKSSCCLQPSGSTVRTKSSQSWSQGDLTWSGLRISRGSCNSSVYFLPKVDSSSSSSNLLEANDHPPCVVIVTIKQTDLRCIAKPRRWR
jgi:hypothetical protein